MELNVVELQEKALYSHSNIVKYWLWLGVLMIAIQVMIGGITRLTGSGLSITKWEIAVGTFPPMGDVAWNEAFELYKETPQYHKINKGMSVSEFKFIYFWEYFHRLWARTLGFVFMIKKKLLRDLIIIVILGGLVGVFGWIMVASGLINRPWVNAYKLTLHLNLAFIVYAYLFWTTIKVTFPDRKVVNVPREKKYINWIGGILIIQLILGGIMSGMKAGLWFPTWPMMNGVYIPGDLMDVNNWTMTNIKEYDAHLFAPALFQFLHRNVAYVLFILGVLLFIKLRKRLVHLRLFNSTLNIFIFSLLLQVTLGILTVINCKGSLPVDLGVMHQMGAICLISATLYLYFRFVNIQKAG